MSEEVKAFRNELKLAGVKGLLQALEVTVETYKDYKEDYWVGKREGFEFVIKHLKECLKEEE